MTINGNGSHLPKRTQAVRLIGLTDRIQQTTEVNMMKHTEQQIECIKSQSQLIRASIKWKNMFNVLCEQLGVSTYNGAARWIESPDLDDECGEDSSFLMLTNIRNAYKHLRSSREKRNEVEIDDTSLADQLLCRIEKQGKKHIWAADGGLYDFRVQANLRRQQWHEHGVDHSIAKARRKDRNKLIVDVYLTPCYLQVQRHFAVIGSGSNRLVTLHSRLIQNPVLEEKGITARKLWVFGRPTDAVKKNRLQYYEEGLDECRVNSPEYLAMLRSIQAEKQLQSLGGENCGAFSHEIYYLEHNTMIDRDGVPLNGHGHTINRAEHLLNRRIKAEALNQLGI